MGLFYVSGSLPLPYLPNVRVATEMARFAMLEGALEGLQSLPLCLISNEWRKRYRYAVTMFAQRFISA